MVSSEKHFLELLKSYTLFIIIMFYNYKVPPVDSICFVKLQNYNMRNTDLGVYVHLVDYDNIEGFIPLTEISKYKINFDKVFKPEKIYPCVVFSFEKSGLVNLSYMKIKEEERNKLTETFVYAQRIAKLEEIICEKKFTYDTIEKNKTKELYYNILETPENYYSKKASKIIKEHVVVEPYESLKEFKFTISENDSLNKLKQSLKLFNDYLHTEYPEYNIECVSSPIYAIRMKHNDIDKERDTELFDEFKTILTELNYKYNLEELELKTYKTKLLKLNL